MINQTQKFDIDYIFNQIKSDIRIKQNDKQIKLMINQIIDSGDDDCFNDDNDDIITYVIDRLIDQY